MSDTDRLDGRVAVITGGGSGIGWASARRLASEGAHVVVDIDESAGSAAAEDVDGLFVRADVTSETDVARMFATAHERSARSTSPSTTPVSHHPTTTRSSPPTSPRGGACKRSTSPRCISAAAR